MTSLAEVYNRTGASRRQLYLGTALFGLGAFMVVAGIVIASTSLLAAIGIGTVGAREIAGVLAGLGVPAVFLGVFIVLPGSRRNQAAATIGAGIAVLGVALFVFAYPDRWFGATSNHITFPVLAIYFLGAIIAFWSLFTAVVNFKTRNDPGGTVTLKRTIEGRTETVEVPISDLEGANVDGFGGVGVVGDVDRDPVTQATDSGEITTSEDPSAAASDGGTRSEQSTPPAGSTDTADQYCGNCSYFEYVHGETDFQPYCGYHDERMDDMEACQHWSPNARVS